MFHLNIAKNDESFRFQYYFLIEKKILLLIKMLLLSNIENFGKKNYVNQII